MAQFSFHLFDITNTTPEAVFSTVVLATEIQELIGSHTLNLTLLAHNSHGERILGSSPEDDGQFDMIILSSQKYVRVYNSADNSYRSFIIRRIVKNHDANRFSYEIYCEAKRMALLNQVVDLAKEYTQLSSDEFLSIVLGYASGFSLGSNEIPSTELRDIILAKPTILEALKYLHDVWTYESGGSFYRYYPIIAEDGTIDILREDNIGADISYPMTYLQGAMRIAKQEESPPANRVYFSGLGNDLAFANNSKVFDDPNMGLLNLGDPPYTRLLNCGGHFTDNVALDSFVTVYMGFYTYWTGSSGTCEVQYRLRLQTAAGSTLYTHEGYSGIMAFPDDLDTVYISFYTGEFSNVGKIEFEIIGYRLTGGATISTVRGRIITLWYDISPNASYVEDATSQASYGLLEYSAQNDQLPKLLNEFRPTHIGFAASYGGVYENDSSFSGVYSSGLSASLNAIGFNTLAENTNPLYIIHGTKSQYVSNAAAGNGVQLRVSTYLRFLAGHSYMALFNFYIVEGSLHVVIQSSGGSPVILFEATTQGLGWVQLVSDTPFGHDQTLTAWYCQVTSASEGATWYWDSVMIARCNEGVQFHKENSADALLVKANRILQNNKDPHVIYEVAAIDLSQLDIEYRDYQFEVGDRLRLFDNEGRIAENLRVFRRQRDLLNAHNMQIILADLSASLAQVINWVGLTPTLRGDI